MYATTVNVAPKRPRGLGALKAKALAGDQAAQARLLAIARLGNQRLRESGRSYSFTSELARAAAQKRHGLVA